MTILTQNLTKTQKATCDEMKQMKVHHLSYKMLKAQQVRNLNVISDSYNLNLCKKDSESRKEN